jgi:hypothetical protein
VSSSSSQAASACDRCRFLSSGSLSRLARSVSLGVAREDCADGDVGRAPAVRHGYRRKDA